MDRTGLLLVCLLCASTRILGQTTRCELRRSLADDCPCPLSWCTQCTRDLTCTACSGNFVPPFCTDCTSGYYGSQCNTRCDQRTPGCALCTKQGACTSCKTGYTGLPCTECVNGFHGDQCGSPCSTIQSDIYTQCTQCTQDSRCTACSSNFQAPGCTDCASGYYKSSNQCYQCSINCKDRQCNRDTGKCGECADGFHGDKCDSPCSTIQSDAYTQCTQCTQDGRCTACSNNYQVPTCTDCASGYYKSSKRCYQCSSSCTDGQCNRDTGKCGGCVDGRYGDRCDKYCPPGCARCDQDSGDCTACSANSFLKFPGCTDCEDGYYRQSLSISYCSACQGTCYNNAPCNKTTGHCQQCPPGKKGYLCNQACDAGTYGLHCALPCGHCQGGGGCDPESGTCPLCHPGYYPPTCHDACRDKTYGQNCIESCGQCKGGQPCDTATGECTDGCQSGYLGALCKTQCEAGLYGERCNETCGHCQVNTTCHHEDGHCLAGCVADFNGPLCLQDTTNDVSASNLVGPIVGAILGVGVLMTITGVICWRRKSKSSRSSGQDPPKTSPTSMQDSAPKARLNPSPLKQSSSTERRDPDNIYEIYDIESNYDTLSPYSNDDASRDPYMQLTSQANDVKTPASNGAYVNAELSV